VKYSTSGVITYIKDLSSRFSMLIITYIMNDWIRERNDIYNSNIFCLISLVTLLYVITYIIRVHRVPVRSFHLPSPQRESNFVPFFLSLSTVEPSPFSRAFVTSPCRGHPLLLVEHAYASSPVSRACLRILSC